jgi:Fe-S-cluster containining protein
MTLDSEQVRQLRKAIRLAKGRPEALAAVGRIYHDLQAEIDRRKPLCAASGRCCRFEEFGHRLFITTIELAKFAHDREGGVLSDEVMESVGNWDGRGCPFQVEGLCGVHLIRPFGCRIFFCDSTATDWQQEQYEHFHAQMKQLHQEMGVPYYYVEWRQGLRAIGVGS